MLNKKTIDDADLAGKRILMRVDFNVPLDEGGNITNDLRIRAAWPTVEKVLERGGAVVLMSHLGRPRGAPDPKYSLSPVYRDLRGRLGSKAKWASDCVGPEAARAAESLKPGEVLLVENVRFHVGETENDPEFSKRLADLGEIYVNDAFGAAHRAHASTEGAARLFDLRLAGYLMVRELEFLENVVSDPRRPYVAVAGGAKVADKIRLLERLIDRVDALLVGGGMAFTFLASLGKKIGGSLLEAGAIEQAARTLKAAEELGKRVLLPTDVIVAREIAEEAETRTVSSDEIPDGWMGLDIGPETRAAWREEILKAGTVLWNGPVGVFEKTPFAHGSRSVAQALADSDCVSVIGGGDSAAAVFQFGLQDRMSHISTGGGASLELLEGRKLPGVEVLSDR